MIDPTELRIALAKHTPFKCQEMNDANELLDTIYECFAQSQVGCFVLGGSGTRREGAPVPGSGKRAGRQSAETEGSVTACCVWCV